MKATAILHFFALAFPVVVLSYALTGAAEEPSNAIATPRIASPAQLNDRFTSRFQKSTGTSGFRPKAPGFRSLCLT
jgi:hypothetical protein